jgi:hypothetical protein
MDRPIHRDAGAAGIEVRTDQGAGRRDVIDLVEMPSANKWPRATNVHTVSEWKNCGVS